MFYGSRFKRSLQNFSHRPALRDGTLDLKALLASKLTYLLDCVTRRVLIKILTRCYCFPALRLFLSELTRHLGKSCKA